MALTKENIVNLLKTNDKAVIRAIIVLNSRQTDDEQAAEGTKYLNGRGVRPCHARMLTSMAKFYSQYGFLSFRQINYWRVLDRNGNMRIGIYAGQLLEVAQAKTAEKVASRELKSSVIERDFGNDMEEKLVLQEQMDGNEDNPEMVEQLQSQVNEIDEFWKKIEGMNEQNR